MAKVTKLEITLLITAALVIYKCANQLPPGGGPLDKTPPKIIEISPPEGTINYHENYFEITFSEYVDKRSVVESIFISPAIEGQKEYDWSGKTLRVIFSDSLKKNTTYTITIGTDVKDLNGGNRMAEAMTFAFSTGEKIYTGMISGKVYGKSIDGTMIFAYKIENNTSGNPIEKKPDFVSQVGANGLYKLVGISDGTYRVFAVLDKYRDLKYNPQEDLYGCYFEDVILFEPNNQITNANFLLTKKDTTAPKITYARMIDKNHIQIEFNKDIDSINTHAENFYLYDSTNNVKVVPKYFFKGSGRKNQYSIAFTGNFNENDKLFLFSNRIADRQNNYSGLESTPVYAAAASDTTAPKLIAKEGIPVKEKLSYEKPLLNFTFDDGIDSANVFNAISVFDTKNEKYPFKISLIDNSSFIIEIQKKLRQNSEYQIKLDMNKIEDIAGNKSDTVLTLNFTTDSDLDYSAVSGKVKNTLPADNTFVVLDNADNVKVNYKNRVGTDGSFSFKRIVPGKYLIWSFIDKNGNEKYDSGNVYPFIPAEKFSYYPDTLNVRARWPVGDVTMTFDK